MQVFKKTIDELSDLLWGKLVHTWVVIALYHEPK